MKHTLMGTVALLASAAWGQPYGGMGPEMMGGYGPGPGYGMGPGMMRGYGPGHGMGPGMMWGQGPGYGGGPGYGAGPGMMGGRGPGFGMGPGMMRGYGPGQHAIPDLTSEQREKIAGFASEFRRKQFGLRESMHALRLKQEGAFRDGKFDEKAAREQYDAMAAIRKQMFENRLELHKQMEGVLTAKQRDEVRKRMGGAG